MREVIVNHVIDYGISFVRIVDFFCILCRSLKKKVIRCSLLFSSRYINCLPNTKSDISISTLKILFKSVIINISSVYIEYILNLYYGENDCRTGR